MLRCPSCKKPARVSNWDYGWNVYCQNENCDVQPTVTGYPTRNQAVRAWLKMLEKHPGLP